MKQSAEDAEPAQRHRLLTPQLQQLPKDGLILWDSGRRGMVGCNAPLALHLHSKLLPLPPSLLRGFFAGRDCQKPYLALRSDSEQGDHLKCWW